MQRQYQSNNKLKSTGSTPHKNKKKSSQPGNPASDTTSCTFNLRRTLPLISTKPMAYSQVINEILNSRNFKLMFENLNFEFVPTVFLENGQFQITFLKSPKKNPATFGMALNKYDETFAKMKILISKNLSDVKNAYMYYYTDKHVHFYTHYYEFLENLNNAIIYKESLKTVDNIQLVDLGSDDFHFEQVKFNQEDFNLQDGLVQTALFYHKLNFYKYVKGLNGNQEFDKETEFIRSITNPKEHFNYINYRMILLVQSVFKTKISSCVFRYLCSPKSIVFSVIHRILFTDQPFVNYFDEEEFEDIEMEKVQVSDVNFKRTKKVGGENRTEHSGMPDTPTNSSTSSKFKHITEPLVEASHVCMDKIRLEFDNIQPDNNESDIAFSQLFPSSKIKLSELIEKHFKNPCLDVQLKKLQKEYTKEINFNQ